VPPTVALLNYISFGILERIFPKLEFSRGFLYILFTGRNSEAAMGGAVDIILIKKNKAKKVRTCVRTGIYINFDPELTINAPLILKMRDFIFFWQANYIMGHFKGYFEGAKTFLTPKLSRAQRVAILGSEKLRPPRNIPRNGPLCSLPKTK
jgi:hypothetical protein